MTATYDPDLIDRLVMEARAAIEKYRRDPWRMSDPVVIAESYASLTLMADQLEAARREVERLRADSKVAWEQASILADGLEQACSALVADRGADSLRAKLRKLYRDAYRAAKGKT